MRMCCARALTDATKADSSRSAEASRVALQSSPRAFLGGCSCDTARMCAATAVAGISKVDTACEENGQASL